jgi:Cu+-exporting ATPase
MFTLIASASASRTATASSPRWRPALPAAFRGTAARRRLLRAAAVIVVLVLLGQVLELRAREPTGGAIRALLGSRRRPRGASRRRQRARTCRSTRSRSAIGCACGPARRCRSTASSIEGRERVDESMVTGEPMPVEKGAGDQVIGGTSTAPAALSCAPSASARDTLLAQIVQMVARGAAQRARRSSARRRSRLVRAGGDRSSRCARSRVGDSGARAALAPTRCQRGRGADHRLPVRARPGDADVDHGRHRPRREPAC